MFWQLFQQRDGCVSSKKEFIKATATIRECRTKKCPLVASNDMKKLPRGSFNYKTNPKNGVIICKWNDNSVVSLCSNAIGIQPIANAFRFSFATRKRVQIQQPFLVKIYSKHMGGVDRMDQTVTKYQAKIRGKKWYWCLISYMLDAAVNNVWHLRNICTDSDKNPMDLLRFCRYSISQGRTWPNFFSTFGIYGLTLLIF